MNNYFRNAENIIKTIDDFLPIACPDQIVGYYLNDEFFPSKRSNINYLIDSHLEEEATILIVLESPHKSEFDLFGAIGPAVGRSGDNFFKYFANGIKNSKLYQTFDKSIRYTVIFANSVQYQCSKAKVLTVPQNKKERDENWMNFFTNGGREDLLKRINFINPKVIINLCTKGLFDLRNHVEETILNETAFSTRYTRGAHPCLWYNEKFAKIE